MSLTRFSVSDYEELLRRFAGRLPIIGGQATVFWTLRYAPTAGPITSRDIDFLATGEEVREIAPGAVRNLRFPGRRDRTNLSAVGVFDTPSGTSSVEFLHTLPGLDITHSEVIFLDCHTDAGTPIKILEPVSLMMAKLFALRHFDQTDRQDAGHLRALVPACRAHIGAMLDREPDRAFLHMRRLARWMRPDTQKRAALRHHIPLLDVFPHDSLKTHPHPRLAAFSREQLARLVAEWDREIQAFPVPQWGDRLSQDRDAPQPEREGR